MEPPTAGVRPSPPLRRTALLSPIAPATMSRNLSEPRSRRPAAAALVAASVWAVAVSSPTAHGQSGYGTNGYPPDGFVPVRVAPENGAPPTLEANPGDLAAGDSLDGPSPLPAYPGDEQVPGFPEPPEFGQARVPGPTRPAVNALPGTPFFADTEYGARPTPGVPGSPSFGLPHRMEQTNRYGIWYLPKVFNGPNRAVYRPSPWRPRGFGNLFDRPCVTERIDYTPYTVEELPSRYGPTYYPHFRENTECLVRPTRCYDKGPHAENSTGGCRLGSDCFFHHGGKDCPGCRPAGFMETNRPAATACQCEKCRATR